MPDSQPIKSSPPAPVLLDAALQRDIEQLRRSVLNMGSLAEEALKTCLQALLERSRQRPTP
jgi:hypothetical protein